MPLAKVGSYAAAGPPMPLHEVRFGYNTFGQAIADRQNMTARWTAAPARSVTSMPTAPTTPSARPHDHPSPIATTIQYPVGTAAGGDKCSGLDIFGRVVRLYGRKVVL